MVMDVRGSTRAASRLRSVITPDDLVATSSGLAAGTVLGAVVGIATSGPVVLPVGLGLIGLVAGGIVGRFRFGQAEQRRR